jgi:hypothetical protein
MGLYQTLGKKYGDSGSPDTKLTFSRTRKDGESQSLFLLSDSLYIINKL